MRYIASISKSKIILQMLFIKTWNLVPVGCVE
jgi:hypothetical protein